MKHFQSVRLNSLRRLSDDSFVLNSKEHEDALCRACERFTRCPKASTVTQCKEFIPVFVFANPTNLDKHAFNTIRLGRAWYSRLQSGSIVALYDKKFDRMFKAQVTTVYWGSNKEELLTEHSSRNHIGQTLDEPADGMKRILINSYGKNFFDKANGLTAIYLKRI
ncbi:hypothetical protein JCM19235_1329 [Vibrio maritimus]|uniref:Uncharacterized protein n=1 Tax=Vibrio maritimus TaxID=990268 RepID=A0A090S8C9_9VIBR|nr:hypothetical protein JCM19235_1329 [Vibrio maritimus]